MALFQKKATAGVPEDLDAVMKKFDQESNVRIWEGKPKMFVSGFLICFSLFCMWVTIFATFLEEIRLTSFVGLIIIMGFLVFPAKKGTQKVNFMPWYDIVAMVVGAAAYFYFMFNALDIIKQGLNFSWPQIIIGVIGILALAEVCRRSVGLPILIVAVAFLIYALAVGLPSPTLSGKIKYLVRNLFYTKEAIFSTPISACSKYIVVFIIFGAFLERTGISSFFIDLANSVAGKFAGGPAKVAVLSSALCGMVSGSSVGNTVTTGSVTIPMMKKTGYKSEFSGAVEAAASTGGQIMPPIMGAAAFLMADFVGVPYSSILVRAILPAVLYFAGIFIAVHLEAKKLGLKGISKDQLPIFAQMIRKTYLLIPLVALVALVSSNMMTMQLAATIAILLTIVVSLFNKDNRITLTKFFESMEAGARGTISVAAACGIAGIISGTITMTGLANVLINGVVAIANGQVIIALFLTMICCIILGMGVPTTANYCIMASTCAPILTKMGIEPFAAHMFVFYFGIVADITPPVALAAYAGAAIAKAEPMKTAFTATKLAIAAFIVPYVFAMSPELLFLGDFTFFSIARIVLTAFVGIFGISSSLEGYTLTHMNVVQRILSAGGGLLLISPTGFTDIIGIACIGISIVWQFIDRKNPKFASL